MFLAVIYPFETKSCSVTQASLWLSALNNHPFLVYWIGRTMDMWPCIYPVAGFLFLPSFPPVFTAGSCPVAQADLQLAAVLKPQPHKYWNYRFWFIFFWVRKYCAVQHIESRGVALWPSCTWGLVQSAPHQAKHILDVLWGCATVIHDLGGWTTQKNYCDVPSLIKWPPRTTWAGGMECEAHYILSWAVW